MAKEKETTKAIALVDNTGIQKDDDGRQFLPIEFTVRPEGGENDEANSVRLPKMKILNAMSSALKKDTKVDGAEIGMFLNTGTEELHEELAIVPLYLYNERYYNDPGSGELVCMSIDGRGIYGTCMSGQWEAYGIPSEIKSVDERDVEVGICSRCPNAAREWGKATSCQYSKILICTSGKFIEEHATIVKRVESGDPDVISDILNELFLLEFKSTKLKKFKKISDQAARDGSYFRWCWNVSSETESNERGEWENYKITRKRRLDPNEVVFSRSLYKLVQKVRPIITARDTENTEPEEPRQTVEVDVE